VAEWHPPVSRTCAWCCIIVIVQVLLCIACVKRGDPVRGKQFFSSTCDACHYANAGLDLAGLYRRKMLSNGAAVNDENIERLIRKGDHLMLGYHDRITEEQMRDLIAYLRTL